MSEKSFHTTDYSIKKYTHFISNVREYEFYNNQPVHLNPTGCFELIIQNGSFSQSSIDGELWNERPTSFIGGLHHQSFLIQPKTSNASLLSISFKSNAAKFFIPEELNRFRNKIVPLEDIYQSKQLQFMEVLNVSDTVAKLAGVEVFLDRIFQPKSFSAVDEALKIIKQTLGCVPIVEIANKVGLSPSQLRKRFLNEVGISPKVFCRITRIAAIEELMNELGSTNLTELAYRFDYFDQSHFIKDFKSVVGLSPKRYLAEKASP
jgi:AraC-like DNA-binding protein